MSMRTVQLQSTSCGSCAPLRTSTRLRPTSYAAVAVSPRITCQEGGKDAVKTPQEAARAVSFRRRSAVLAPVSLLASAVANPTLAVRDGPSLDIAPIEPFSIEDFSSESGWTELDSGLLYKVLKKGEGDREAGIFDKVDYFQPFPFVTVQYTAYTPNGKGFASSYADRRAYSYQVGVRQELQDEDGAIMSMYVGERRQFVIPFELAFKRKLFGNIAPQNQEALLVEVELLKLRPY
mmetsp:Transcript_35856/g.78282  ORF Transcript_35856/g.78282 Transcript_35856/m.78282 type:complete len:235 (+) Transcript_35856:47-751(+)|eukprot:CAMPEP_0118928392 /NCGR_PEP_ID=MMETSP1169-20130426/5650_1 /TAXON_ID=36882 /ORGANISM="Pyramimonas obovata, Strain CCMP722" /LENGTH=234 /DNA_ID=CAMNT_0006870345 /DNA_START=39 /DNA_END=743 /DNA_ORIENTATION=-